MKGYWAVMFVLALALSSMLLAGSGWTSMAGVQDDGDGVVVREVRDVANDSAIHKENGSFQGSAKNPGESSGTIIGFIIRGGQILLEIFKLVVLMPIWLNEHGFPWWFALPVGIGWEIIVSTAFIQVIMGRVVR